MSRQTAAAMVVCLGLLGATLLQAHHSAVLFDLSKTFTMTGTMMKLDWRNPDVEVFVDVKDDSGTIREGRSSDLPLRLQDRWQVGDSILVLYDQFDPAQNEVDLFDQRRDDLAMLKARSPAAPDLPSAPASA